jgi:hypothetical protein
MSTTSPGAEEIRDENPPAIVNAEMQQVAEKVIGKIREEFLVFSVVFPVWRRLGELRHAQQRYKSESSPESGEEELRRITVAGDRERRGTRKLNNIDGR